MVTFELTLAAVVVALLIVASVTDGHSRIIPDWVNISIALLALPFWWVTHLTLWPGLALQLAIATVVFVVFLGAFRIGQMGGGDVKLLTAVALLLPPLDFLDAFVGTAMVGGILTSVQLVRHTLHAEGRRFENPYGISIALGAIVALGGRYGYLPETDILRIVTPVAILSCVAAFAFRLAHRRLSRSR
ncbi:prepilin peptidase [Sphingomonas sp. SUN039]|uniref:A24 family peptidase n=1 Tax=Sphingomonas sp. SUN039 TaxID=2937787 RepID=UPI0021648EC1|nr:prepilin peptidase [Sphingomonas sp. SUN039]UVO53352.1 prepilin peptidase [Sphingomonas sp. SUN039]